MAPKLGSVVWADMAPNGLPWLVSLRLSGGDPGIMWFFTGTFDHTWWRVYDADENPYVIELATNLIFHSLGLPPISDIGGRREARRVLTGFRAQRLLVLHMMEWADAFGANTNPLSRSLTDLDEEARNAMDLYLERDYPATISFMREMSSEVAAIVRRASDLKDQALFWVYVSEWLTITAATIISGSVLWSLMIRRRLYRGVRVTRLS
jgi:hypothetical protein